MSNELTLFNGGSVPAHIVQRGVSANTLALAGNSFQGKRISIEGGVFRLIMDGKEVAKNKNRDMNIVIVRTAPTNSRVYYDPAVPYVRGQATPPLCSSVDGIKPDAHVSKQQAATCDKCPQNIAGSGNNDSRACRYNRRLAVVLDGDIGGDVYQLQLPATSLFGKGNGSTQNLPLEAYARMLHANNVSIDAIVTKMEFDTDASTPKLTFTAVRYLEPDELATVERQGETPEAEQAIGLTPYQMDNGGDKAPAIAAPAAAAPAPKNNGFEQVEQEAPAPAKKNLPRKAAPVVTDEPEEDDSGNEPTKAEAPAPTRDSRISAVVAAWGD